MGQERKGFGSELRSESVGAIRLGVNSYADRARRKATIHFVGALWHWYKSGPDNDSMWMSRAHLVEAVLCLHEYEVDMELEAARKK